MGLKSRDLIDRVKELQPKLQDRIEKIQDDADKNVSAMAPAVTDAGNVSSDNFDRRE